MIDWIHIKDKKPNKFGWYIAAVLPKNHSGTKVEGFEKCTLEGDNNWRKNYGFTKVWFNNGDFYEPSFHGRRTTKITELVTHWSSVPNVPFLEETHDSKKVWQIYARDSPNKIFDILKDRIKSEDFENQKFKEGFFECLKLFGIN